MIIETQQDKRPAEKCLDNNTNVKCLDNNTNVYILLLNKAKCRIQNCLFKSRRFVIFEVFNYILSFQQCSPIINNIMEIQVNTF